MIVCKNGDEKTQTRDTATQTALTFPLEMPKDVEDCLKNHRLFNEDEADDTVNSSVIDIPTLRRKLFINSHPETPELPKCYDDLSPAPRTPQLKVANRSGTSDRMDISFGSDMFGELSPIHGVKNCSSFNDVSILSDNQTPPGRRKPGRGKNLSESFSVLQYSEELKENIELSLEIDQPKRFGRFDSGFLGDEDSKCTFVLNSNEFMQL